MIEANNELVEMARAEEQEILRILAELTDRVRERLDELVALVETIGELDWIFCRAHSAERMRATPPVIDADGTVSLRAARHPLLLAQSWKDASRPVVPVDLELSRQRPLLLVTGPNAGGKTVALKTLALCALLAQVGGHVPAEEGSRLPVFDGVFAIVGDDQSVANHLSTFSAFVTQVREILTAPTRAPSCCSTSWGGDRPRRGRGARPGHPGGAGGARRPGDGHHAPRAAEGVREHPPRAPATRPWSSTAPP